MLFMLNNQLRCKFPIRSSLPSSTLLPLSLVSQSNSLISMHERIKCDLLREKGGMRMLVSKVIVGESKARKEYDKTKITTQIKERNAPRVLWQPYEEFPLIESRKERHQIAGYRRRKLFKRIFQIASKDLLSVHSIGQILAIGYIVYLIGVVEAWLQLRPDIHPFSIDPDPKGLIFLNAYAMAQIIPSCVWSSLSTWDIAMAVGMDPSKYLSIPMTVESFDPFSSNSTVSDAIGESRLKILLGWLTSARYTVAGFGLITQALRIFHASMDAGSVYHQSVLAGKENIEGGVKERVFRLCSQRSEVTLTSMRRYGDHILPISSSLSDTHDMLKRAAAEGPRLYDSNYFPERFPGIFGQSFFVPPVHIIVNPDKWGFSGSWRHLILSSSDLIFSTTGKAFLCVEADGTDYTDPLGVIRRPVRDFKYEDITQAFQEFRRLARKSNLKYYRSLFVYLGDHGQVFRTGRGQRYTLVERNQSRNECDVIIDAAAPVLARALGWCDYITKKERVIEEGETISDADYDGERCIVLETHSAAYYDLISTLLKEKFNIRAIDAVENDIAYTRTGSLENKHPRASPLPRLVVHEKGLATVNSVRALAMRPGHLVDISKLCCIVPSEDDAKALDELSFLWGGGKTQNAASPSQKSKALNVICTAEIYDDIFRQVRIWARLGYSRKSIQKSLDDEFGRFYRSQPNDDTKYL